ncbi:DUF4148 domain-containing protein [Paraburkholderia guartelaensis]|uniref:DUF4148 domain-containing protein n=2 Tax=Paraburkholderia guartelaensis TaxID=2546446 RepID=A0A4R5L3M2_9BURK|nr:DUF4148 domain-containing protein [Paraburkholderia guartelaensis]TDG03268.1 DUF4148 domain-containing protein [Paraburkholderia guartelaensis]
MHRTVLVALSAVSLVLVPNLTSAQAQPGASVPQAGHQADTQIGAQNGTQNGAESTRAQSKQTRKEARKQARAQRNAELKQLEKNGYNPATSNDANYPQDIQNAERKAGNAGTGSAHPAPAQGQ